MKLVLFIGWVLLIFICSDLVGSALWFGLSLLPPRQASADGQGHGTCERGSPVDFVQSTLLGFATIWVGLSVAYAIGIATQGLIVAFIGLSAAAAALVQRGHVVGWARSRLTLWGLVGAVALLASFVTPIFNVSDDPEYFFFINKLLRTGAIVEYFSYRRPITLGGWTFIQAIFSAGPAGVAFVASIDAIVGSILLMFCAILLGTGVWAALPAALVGVLAVRVFQVNLGTAIDVAAMCAVLVCLSLPACAPRNSFTPIAFSVMAVTIRPQLGLIAIIGIALVLWRNRSTSLLIVGAILAGISIVWVAIFLRDTGGLLPLSTSPGYNPQFLEQTEVVREPLLSRIQAAIAATPYFWRNQAGVWPGVWAAANMTVLALVICGWQSATTKHGAAIRNEFLVLGAFCIAAVATVVGMIAMIGPKALSFQRYYIPVLDGVLYVFLIRSAVHILQRGPGRLSKYASLPVVSMIAVLCIAVLKSEQNLSVPTESAGRICSQLLTPEERRMFGGITAWSGYVLLAINCPIGSFEISSRVMMNDLFSATRGYYFDITSDAQATANWLRKHGVGQLVYLDDDASDTYAISNWQFNLERIIKSGCSVYSCDSALERRREYYYWFESLDKFRKLAKYCDSVRIPILDPQGPLVVVDVRQCKNQRFATSGWS